MKKTVGDMAKYMKQLLPVTIPEDYPIKSQFKCVSQEDAIRTGVVDFRDFMVRLCDALIADQVLCDLPIKGDKNFSDEVTLTVQFPFIGHIKNILINVGQYGILSKSGDSLIVSDWRLLSLKRSLNKHSNAQISVPQMLKSLRFLEQCGIKFGGIDLGVKKPDIEALDAIEITYPDKPTMLVGWKALGLAQSELATRKHDDILLRCDFRMLSDGEMSSAFYIFKRPLSEPLKAFVESAHHHYLDSGLICEIELGFYCIHFNYLFKRKMVWRFSVSFHKGHRLVLKTKHTHKYLDVIESFPDYLREKISKGYGCDRKKGASHGNCNKGCEGISFNLDDDFLNIGSDIMLWQDHELASMS